jgi:pimeloyl-ACP methyl ester carboxylesterase
VIRLLFRLSLFRQSNAGLGGCFWDKQLIEGAFKELFVQPIVADRRRALGICRFLAALDWRENDLFAVRHREITCPVSLIWGADDPTFPLVRARKMAPQFPACVGLHVIERAKLFVHEERPDEVNACLLPFLRGELDLHVEAKTAASREDMKC